MCALTMPFGFVGVTHRARPATVPVQDHADVFGDRTVADDGFEPPLVGAVEEITWGERHAGGSLAPASRTTFPAPNKSGVTADCERQAPNERA